MRIAVIVGQILAVIVIVTAVGWYVVANNTQPAAAPVVIGEDILAVAAPSEEASTNPAMPGITGVVSEAWAQRAAQATGIPERAVLAYAGAALALAKEQPDCRIAWTTVAGIGAIESGHGTHGDSNLDDGGYAVPPIFGPELSDDTRAAGPMQFIPSTWAHWGADGNGDGVADPQQVDDAALTTARYLCRYGPLTSATAWRDAVFAYNHDDAYVDLVATRARDYGRAAFGV